MFDMQSQGLSDRIFKSVRGASAGEEAPRPQDRPPDLRLQSTRAAQDRPPDFEIQSTRSYYSNTDHAPRTSITHLEHNHAPRTPAMPLEHDRALWARTTLP